jgi:hypothetical protein
MQPKREATTAQHRKVSGEKVSPGQQGSLVQARLKQRVKMEPVINHLMGD